jgi:hypothetical protein
MTPTILNGTRGQFTSLDWAGLQDVGWQVTGPTPTPAITVQPTAGLTTTEAGGAATLTVVLNTVPTANVTISLSSSNPGAGTVSPALLTFTPGDALIPQIVTVTGVDDGAVQGNVSYTIVTRPAVSSDPAYNGLDPGDVSVTNLETDPPPQPTPTPNPVGLRDATAFVQVTRGPVKRHGKLSRQAITLTNRGADPLTGPLTLVLVGLSRKIRLVGQAGLTASHAARNPYVEVGIDAVLPGASVRVVLNFRNPGSQRLRYSWMVLSGSGVA